MSAIAWSWRPIAAPENPEDLAFAELRPFAELWKQQRARLAGSGALRAFEDRMKRWWSIETGIIERLYDLSEGVTLLLVEHGFQANLLAHADQEIPAHELIEILKDHRESLDFLMDIVGNTRELSVSWIKELHALLTRHQKFSTAITLGGQYIDVELIRGDFKKVPNNPLSGEEGGVHEYCPPEQVGSEMDRLVEIYSKLPAAYPEVRAAWLHHAFTQIHPFQDGNGRVARALASIDFIKAGLFPLVVDRKERDAYLKALRAADGGDLRELVHLFAKIQQHLLTRALSEAVQATDVAEGFDAVLSAASAKQHDRLHQRSEHKTLLQARGESLVVAAYDNLRQRGAEIEARVANVQCTVQRSNERTSHYYRQQLLHLGKAGDFWVDLREPRAWIRLSLRDGGLTEIVVALFFVGNPSPGAGMAAIFLQHRESREKRVGLEPPIQPAIEPLLLVPGEDERQQRERFMDWLEVALVQALAVWTRFL